mmetsp:Transcript_741/g.2024  ORF Transcript_741/g.2024 Transcript_741/m.2024 type:complete len:297 (+) Transcript_741:2947-3837(+)
MSIFASGASRAFLQDAAEESDVVLCAFASLVDFLQVVFGEAPHERQVPVKHLILKKLLICEQWLCALTRLLDRGPHAPRLWFPQRGGRAQVGRGDSAGRKGLVAEGGAGLEHVENARWRRLRKSDRLLRRVVLAPVAPTAQREGRGRGAFFAGRRDGRPPIPVPSRRGCQLDGRRDYADAQLQLLLLLRRRPRVLVLGSLKVGRVHSTRTGGGGPCLLVSPPEDWSTRRTRRLPYDDRSYGRALIMLLLCRSASLLRRGGDSAGDPVGSGTPTAPGRWLRCAILRCALPPSTTMGG